MKGRDSPLASTTEPILAGFAVREVTLVDSEPRSSSARYRIVARWPAN